ncbi:MAG: cell envelope integrity protein CreD [Spirochaetales bacterium]|nr:cell envelope integrity protein CreD [Spirochaetales bacterium]
MENENKIKKRIHGINSHSMGLKIVLILILLLLFLIPLRVIRAVMEERQSRCAEVENEITYSIGGPVSLGGPILSVPREWEVPVRNDEGKIIRYDGRREIIYILPDSLDIRAVANSMIKSRGIYSVPVFDLLLDGEGSITPGESLEGYNPEEICWDEASLQFSYPYLKGMKTIRPLKWNDEEFDFQPGGNGYEASVYGGVMSVRLKLEPDLSKKYSFSFSQEMRGGESIHFLPLAKETRVAVSSDWASPSFNGYYLPSQSKLNDNGFSADWEINYLSRGIPQSWTSSNSDIFRSISDTSFGVRFFPVVTAYNKTERTLKYGFLFLVLPFLTFFLFEVTRKHRIHPIQYLLAGVGDLMFYLLLLSLSEQMPFNGAYLIASAAVTLMLTFYAASVLRAKKSAAAMIPVMGLSYGYLYFVLQSEDYALLMGSIGLFVIVSVVMYLTRKVEWYGKAE